MNDTSRGDLGSAETSRGNVETGRQSSRVCDVIEVIARALTDHPDQVRVMESKHRGSVLVELYVAPGELGRVIGKQGRTAAALRTLAATAGEQEGKTVTLEFRESR
jgi:predicted RNA-binding protein YlqC (UPF0109 family)